MSSQECKHNYVAEKYTVQERTNEYQSSGKYDTATLSHERIILFCTKCGDTKKIDLEEPKS